MKNKYLKLVVLGGLIVALFILGVREINNSQILGQNYRYSMVLAGSEGEVEFVSYDPEQKQVIVIPWPKELSITSRSVGSYLVGDLYQLGSYDNTPGEFVRQKVQGYMKSPIMGYVQVEGELGSLQSALIGLIVRGARVSEISRLDSVILLSRSMSYDKRIVEKKELARAGVILESEEKYQYQEGRLQQFLGKRIFDWGVGEEELSVAVVNNSQITGLATDVASFFGNAGLDVVAVRSGAGEEEETQIIISSELGQKQRERVAKMLLTWFGFEKVEEGDTSEFRSEIVVKLGRDAEELF